MYTLITKKLKYGYKSVKDWDSRKVKKSTIWLSRETQVLFDIILQSQPLPPQEKFLSTHGSSKEAGSTSLAQQVTSNEKSVSLIKTITYTRYIRSYQGQWKLRKKNWWIIVRLA